MARRVDERPSRAPHREAQRVVDDAAGDLVVAGETRKDRQAGRVGGRPAAGPQAVRAHVPDCARSGVPRGPEVEELVERAGVAVDDDRVPVAVGGGPALDGDVGRNRVRAGIALLVVVEVDPGLRLRAAHDGDGDPDRAAVPESRAEVGVDVEIRADRPHDGGRALVQGQLVDPLVPDARGGKDRAVGRAGKRGRAARSERGERGSRRRGPRGEQASCSRCLPAREARQSPSWRSAAC